MQTLSHTAWKCVYHLVFVTKYRKPIITQVIRSELDSIIHRLCSEKEITISALEICPDHLHLCASIPPSYSISEIVGFLKGKSSSILRKNHPELTAEPFWSRGYYVSTVGDHTLRNVIDYIKRQWE